MSEGGKEQVAISVEELLARATQLKEHIDAVTATLNTYLVQYSELQLAYETLKNLPERVPESYVVVDRLSMVLIPLRVSDNWMNSVLVNLGLGYYIKTNRDKAMDIIQRRIQEVEKIISDIQSQRQQLLKEYVAIQRIIGQIAEAQQAQNKK